MTSLDQQLTRFFTPDAQLMADPFPLYRLLREQGPAYRFKDRVLVTHYETCREVLAAPMTLQGITVRGSRYRTAVAGLEAPDVERIVELFAFYEKRLTGIDGEKHRKMRGLVQRAFTHRVVSQMQGRIQEITDGLLDDVGGRETIEFVEDVAYHLPLIVICELLGIPRDDRPLLRSWATDLGRFVGADWTDLEMLRQTYTSVFEMRRYLTDFFVTAREGRTTELLGALLAAVGDDDDQFTEDELVAVITLFVFAGHETTTNLLANSLVMLLGRHPDQWERLRADAGLVPSAVEELLRCSGTTQYLDKLAAEDTVIGGVEIRAMDTVCVVVAAGNRDETVFADAERFDVGRSGRSHLTFGFGPHHCLGAALARMETATLFSTLLRRFPEAQLEDPGSVTYAANSMLRGPERLVVRLGMESG